MEEAQAVLGERPQDAGLVGDTHAAAGQDERALRAGRVGCRELGDVLHQPALAGRVARKITTTPTSSHASTA